MKNTLSVYDIANALLQDQHAGWSYAGAQALASFLDENCDENEEFDVVAIRCEFSEYADFEDYYSQNSHIGEGLDDEDVKEWIEDNALLIEFEGGIIVQDV